MVEYAAVSTSLKEQAMAALPMLAAVSMPYYAAAAAGAAVTFVSFV